MKIIKTKNLSRIFGKIDAIKNINLEIEEGEIFGILGPNGAGKTTTISILSTLLRPTRGTALVNNYDVINKASKVRESIGVVFQETVLDNDLTAYTNLKLHAQLYRLPKELREKRIRDLLGLVDLFDRRNDKIETFSGGMKRKLEIVRGFLHHPKILFLDEPTLGLDPKGRREIWNQILKLNKEEKITIIITTHYMEEADFLCDRIAILNKGKLIIAGEPSKLKNSLKGDVIEIKLKTTRDSTFKKLKKQRFIKEIIKENNSLFITLSNGETKVERIVRILKESKEIIQFIKIQKPTLEDVFLYHTGEKLE